MTTAHASTPNFEAVGARLTLDLDGPWNVRMDPDDVGLSGRWSDGVPSSTGQDAFVATVPSVLQQYVPDMHGGIAWYERWVDVPESVLDRSLRLRIGAADYHATVWWNGTQIGDHEGGFTPFDAVVGSAVVAGPNRVTIRVSDVGRDFRPEYHGLPGWDKPTTRRVDGHAFNEIPTGHQDWKEGFEFSGIWQHVEVLAIDAVRVADVFVIPRWREGMINLRVALDNGRSMTADVTIEASVRPWTGGAEVGASNRRISAAPGVQELDLTLDLENARAWSVDDPYLYVVTVAAVIDGTIRDSAEVRFGLRELTVSDDGFFELNGERIFIKGAHYQSTEPVTLAFPHSVAMARRLVELAKAGGFNFMRLQLRPTVPAILDAADELGILCMCEPPLSKMRDSAEAEALGLRETIEMIRRDRNRPSIILWLMANEQPDAMNVVHEMCIAAREADPTRLIMESAGGPSHYYLPGTPIGTSYLTEHYFQGQPIAEGLLPYVLDRGVANQLYFVTEFAVTGLADDDAVLAAYGEHPLEHMEDYRSFVRHREELRETFERTDLRDVFPTISAFRQATQVFQANSVELLVGGLRANPRLGGYNIVQLADSNGNELSGLVDFWRSEPKLAFERIKQLNQPVNLLVHLLPFNPRTGDPVRIAVTLVDERGGRGPGRLSVDVTTADGKSTQVVDERVTPERWVTRLSDKAITIDGPSGPMVTRATLVGDDGARLEGEGRATLFSVAEMPWPKGFRIFDPQGRWPTGHDPRPWGGQPTLGATGEPSIIVAPAFQRLWGDRSDLEAFVDVVDEARRGSTLLFLGVPSDGPAPNGMRFLALIDVFHALMTPAIVGFEFHAVGANAPWGGLVGGPYAWSVGETDAGGLVTSHPVFAGLPGPGLMDWQYSSILPNRTVSMRRRTIDSTTGAGIKIVRIGAGRVVFCTFRLIETFGRDGAGERLFANLLTYLEASLPAALRDRTAREVEAREFQATQIDDCYRMLARLDPSIRATR